MTKYTLLLFVLCSLGLSACETAKTTDEIPSVMQPSKIDEDQAKLQHATTF